MGNPPPKIILETILASSTNQQFTAITREVLKSIDSVSDSKFISDLLSTYAERILLYLAKEDESRLTIIRRACTPGQKEETPNEDFAATYDGSFLGEYIEKHLSMLGDFEAAILDHQVVYNDLSEEDKKEASTELAQYCRRYLHNIKGDSGSIGLVGLEKLFHFLEDLLETSEVNGLIPLLLETKSWSVDYLNALAAGSFSRNAAVTLLLKIKTDQAGSYVASSETSQSSSSSESMINYDLLAEVMGDDRLLGGEGLVPEEKKVVVVETLPAAQVAFPSVGTSYTIAGEADLLNDFMAESEDHLQNVEAILLEQGEHISKDSLDSVFRSIHSIKGSSAYFTLREVVESAHRTESLLDEVRTGKRKFNKGFTELLVSFLDLQRKLLAEVKKASQEKCNLIWSQITTDYLMALERYATSGSVGAGSAVAEPRQSEEGEKAESTSGEKVDVKSYLKIETRRLDQLLDAIGEMGIYCSMLIQTCREKLGEDAAVVKMSHQVEKVTRDVQNIGMSMRLIPIRGLFQKMSRLVWDLSRKVGKDIKFRMEGEETEMDRSMIDRLADPLMHMIRNALDHGVEPPEEREKNGKSRTGNIVLSASQVGGSIHITIQDDGRGMDPARLIKKAVEKGILRADEKLSPQEAFQLIFAAGFSTAAVVTDISGRGVGMDVVRRNIEAMRGRVHIDSVLGAGTKFTIELPLTLALIDGIEVRVGTDYFIFPMLSIVEFLKPDPDSISSAFDRGETFSFRGQYLPVYRLGELLNINARAVRPEEGSLVIVEAHGERYAVMVDDVIGTCSTLIKSLGDMFDEGHGVAGCSISANGDVRLILDVHLLRVLAKEYYQHTKRSPKAHKEASQEIH